MIVESGKHGLLGGEAIVEARESRPPHAPLELAPGSDGHGILDRGAVVALDDFPIGARGRRKTRGGHAGRREVCLNVARSRLLHDLESQVGNLIPPVQKGRKPVVSLPLERMHQGERERRPRPALIGGLRPYSPWLNDEIPVAAAAAARSGGNDLFGRRHQIPVDGDEVNGETREILCILAKNLVRVQIGGMGRHLDFGEMQRAAKRLVRRGGVPFRHESHVVDDVAGLRADSELRRVDTGSARGRARGDCK